MISKEQIAHDLAIVYMKNRYGINVTGDFYISGASGSGTVKTERFPDASEPEYTKVKTGEKGLFGLERKKKFYLEIRLTPYLPRWFKTTMTLISIFTGCCVNEIWKRRNK